MFGGLNNGWHGAYSHPPTSLNCQGGAGGELNPWNRKLAVVSVSGNKVLQMNPNDNGYVNTYSIYANDDVDFYEHSRWSTDVYIDNAYSGGYFDIVLSTGKMSAIQPLAYLPSIANGRLEILDFIKFHDDGTIFCLEEAVTTYQKKTWYTVELSIDQNEGGPQFNFRLIQKSYGECLFETGETDLPFSIEDDAAGIG